MKNIQWLKTLALVLAVALIVSVGFMTSGKVLKAADGDDVIVENPSDTAPEEVVQEIVIPAEEAPAEEAPVEETVAEEQPAEEASEEETSEDAEEQSTEEASEEEPSEDATAQEQPDEEKATEEESEPAASEKTDEKTEEEKKEPETEETAKEEFDVESAGAQYASLDDAAKEEYLSTLSQEDKEALLKYVEELKAAEEKKKEEAKSVDLWYDYSGKLGYGSEITICSNVQGYSDKAHYQWVYSDDGEKTWKEIPGANSQTYKFILDENNNWYSWDLIVTE